MSPFLWSGIRTWLNGASCFRVPPRLQSGCESGLGSTRKAPLQGLLCGCWQHTVLRTGRRRALAPCWQPAGAHPPRMLRGPPHVAWTSPYGGSLQSSQGASMESLLARWKRQTYIMYLWKWYPFAIFSCLEASHRPHPKSSWGNTQGRRVNWGS